MEKIDDINENSHKQIIQTLEKNINKYNSSIIFIRLWKKVFYTKI